MSNSPAYLTMFNRIPSFDTRFLPADSGVGGLSMKNSFWIVVPAVLCIVYLKIFRSKRKYAPGPPGIPFFGNLFQLPSHESWKVYLHWSKVYNSDILSLKFPGTHFVILNNAKVVQELLVKRSSIYSDRPRSTLLYDLIKTGWLIVFMNQDERWKLHRHIFRREFDTREATAVNRTHEVQAARRLLRRLLKSKDYEGELRLAAVDSVLSITYGITPTNFEHPFIQVTEAVNAIFADVAKGRYLVDIFPFLRYLPSWTPGATFWKVANRGEPLAKSVVTGPFAEVQAKVDDGTALPSVASRFLSMLQDGEKLDSTEVEATRNVLANAYLAGSDTSICALYNFVLAMATYPEVQKKAQKDLDALLQGQRLPEFSDFEKLPYLAAIVNEVFRWQAVTPFAVYHVSTADDVYEGYFIPKGSIVVPNAWAILRDETIFGPNTDRFMPERFINPEKTTVCDLSEVDMAFGFGRRACPGRFIARDTIWIMAASILAAYNISNAKTLDGKVITPETQLEYTNAMISFAPRFTVTFTPRVPESVIQYGVSHEDISSN